MKIDRTSPPDLPAWVEQTKATQGVDEILKRAREDDERESHRESHRLFHARKASSLDAPVLRTNKKAARRRYSTFGIMIVIFSVGIGVVLYISNIITVNHLAAEIGRLEDRYDEIRDAEERLRAEVNKKSALDRIESLATERLSLRFPQGQRLSITLDEELVEAVVEGEPSQP